jgi:hypothetical protein
MIYKITAKSQNGDTLNTSIEFTYDGEVRKVDVPHFQPKSLQEIENGIQNRIASEVRAIDATKAAAAIDIELNVDNAVVYIPSESVEENPLSGYSVEDLKAQIVILSNEYNVIMGERNILDSQLTENSAKYDLLLEELAKRI